MSDKNLIRFSGDEAGNVWLNDVLLFAADVTGTREYMLADIVVAESEGIRDALKLGGVRRLVVHVGSIDARFAAEDAIDINHCEDVAVIVGQLWPGRKYAGTIKGASKRVRVEVAQQHGHGGETDWDWGNFSDQGNSFTSEGNLNVTTADGSPARVRLLSANPPALENGAAKYQVSGGGLVSRWFYRVYNALKDLLHTFGIEI